MRVVVSNVENQSIVDYPVILIEGRVENYSSQVSKDHSPNSHLLLVTHNLNNERPNCVQEVQMFNLRFKSVVQLSEGDNLVTLEFLGVVTSLTLIYKPPVHVTQVVKLVYIVCNGHDGTFQSPPGLDNSVSSALRKIQVAGRVLQTVMAETLSNAGLERRTFHLEEDSGFVPMVHIHQSSMTVQQSWSMSSERLWEEVAREIMTCHLADNRSKYIAFLSSTRYVNSKGVRPFNHEHSVSMSKGQVALGGGGLALHSTGCLWTWPESLTEVQSTLLDSTKVDSRVLLDDSAYRGTVGGCYATTLGSVLHELGHCFGLGHTQSGIMNRGFDHLDEYLTAREENNNENSTQRRQLMPCGGYKASEVKSGLERCSTFHLGEGGGTRGFTKVRRGEKVARYLEEYKDRRLGGKLTASEKCSWSKSCALILNSQPWIEGHDRLTDCLGSLTLTDGVVKGCCKLVVVELRGERDMVRQYWEVSSDKIYLTDLAMTEDTSEIRHLVAVAACGNIKKQSVAKIK